MGDMLHCILCNRKYESLVESSREYCSDGCRRVDTATEEFGEDIKDYKNPTDTRVFFYDIGFGDLCDRFSILMLRYYRQKSLADKQQTSALLERVRQAILTKVNRIGYQKDDLQSIVQIFYGLCEVNAALWRVRDDLRVTTYARFDRDPQIRERQLSELSVEYFDLSDRRDSLRHELDEWVELHPRMARVWSPK